jgi:4-hydroxybenzoate polyprenyltransferase
MKPAFILFYLSMMGFLSIFSAQKYLGLSIEPLNGLTYMGIIFGVYTLNRFTDTAEDFTNDIGRLLFFQRKKAFLYLAVAALSTSIGALLLAEKLNWMHLLLLAMGFAYSYRMIPWYSRAGGLRLVRIKEMTFVKNLAVSFLWSASVFVVPILYSGAKGFDVIMVWLLACGLFISTLNNTLFDDIMDEPGDRVAGIKTLPAAWGARNSAAMLMTVDVAWLIGVAFLRLGHRIDSAHAAFLAFLGLYPFLYMGLWMRKAAPKGLIDFLSETDLLLFAIGMLLLSAR